MGGYHRKKIARLILVIVPAATDRVPKEEHNGRLSS